MQVRSVGIDLGKMTFHLVALSAAGKVLLRELRSILDSRQKTVDALLQLVVFRICRSVLELFVVGKRSASGLTAVLNDPITISFGSICSHSYWGFHEPDDIYLKNVRQINIKATLSVVRPAQRLPQIILKHYAK